MKQARKRRAQGKQKHGTIGRGGRLPWIIVVLILIGGLVVFLATRGPGGNAVTVRVPELSAAASQGSIAFAANCAQCHGANAAGSGEGPPLVHDIYNPGHHADAAFYFAARRGVSQHHWRFGGMPPQPQVSDADLAAIVRYVRELQRANGIEYRPHRM